MSRELVRSIVLTFALSRAMIFALLIAGSQISFLAKDYGGTIWRTEVRLRSERLVPELTRVVMAGDAWYYRQIALEGYEEARGGEPGRTWAFFPGFPLLMRAVSPPLDFAMAALALNEVLLLGGLLAMAAAALRLGMASEECERAVALLCFFPTSYFFSMPLTESLFLCLSALAFLMAAQGRWWGAAIFGAAAAATRVVGVLLLPALLLLPLQQRGRLARGQWWLALIPCGLLGFMAHLWRISGDPLAFVKVQSLWGRGGPALPGGTSSEAGMVVATPWNFVALNVAVLLLLVAAAAAMLRRREWSYGAYTLLSAAVPVLSGSVQSLGRYALVAFPLFLWFGAVTADRRIERALLFVFTILLGWLVALFTLRVDFALA